VSIFLAYLYLALSGFFWLFITNSN